MSVNAIQSVESSTMPILTTRKENKWEDWLTRVADDV